MLFAIGDIHGCAYELRELLNKLPLTSDSTVVFLGDYVDRGSHSREVIETILELREYCNVICLMGNHESLMLEFLADPLSERAGLWIYNGGSSTLATYADASGNYRIPGAHVEFLHTLELCWEGPDHFFVHAGIPDLPLSEIDPEIHRQHMLWMRGGFLKSEFPWEKVVVHGHTPVERVSITPNRINLDTGCVFARRLSAMSFPDQKIYSVPKQRVDRPVYLRDMGSRREAIRFPGQIPVKVDYRGEERWLHTVNFSEVGLLLCDTDPRDGLLFDVGEIVTGVVGAGVDGETPFRGRVVRIDKRDDGYGYAVKVLD